MVETKPTSQWKQTMQPILESKVEEFKLLGYSRATTEDLWKCLSQKVWKGDPEKRLFEIVEDIFHLNSGIYITYLTVEAYQDDDLMSSIAALTK